MFVKENPDRKKKKKKRFQIKIQGEYVITERTTLQTGALEL